MRNVGSGKIAKIEDAAREIDRTRTLLSNLPVIWGNGSPQGVESAKVGTLYVDLQGGATTLWIKESGDTGTGGWVPRNQMSDVDINGGTIDGTVIGGATPAAGTFTGITGTGLSVSAQPAFAAYINTAHTNLEINTTHTLNFDAEHFDIGGNFNTTTKTFTAPTAGIYLFGLHIRLDQMDTATNYYRTAIVTTGRTQYLIYPQGVAWVADASCHDLIMTGIFQMAATDTCLAQIYVHNSGAAQADVPASSYYQSFWGYKLG